MSTVPSNHRKKEKILIIESHVTFGQQLADLLTKEGFETILIRNGSQALRMIYDKLPRLIIQNIVLPDVDSYSILEKKIAEPLLRKIPVFLISTHGMPINMRRIPQGSATDFVILFNSDPSEVVEKVKKYFSGDRDESPTPKQSPRETGKIKILWVEDDKLISNILGKKIRDSGFDLKHVTNGDEAIEYLKGNTPNIIILDILLPGLSGFEILQKIDMDPLLKKIPVMILSNLDKESDKAKAKMLGAKKYLVKATVSLEQIIDEVRRTALL